jgi:prolyl-tRNA editing enzyme YbaK/EbsC (Cys-tRNA(Pro) deacylase)
MVSHVSAWPESVERVAAFLRAAGADARIEELAADTATAEAAAEAVGSDLAGIVKSLVALCDDRPVLALVPGDRRADLSKIARAAGSASARIARAREVEVFTGFTPGAVAPFPLPRIERVLVEKTLLGRDSVWVGAGSTRHLATLPTGELVRLTKAEPVDLVEV